jgi:hypothetical protein
MRQMPGPTPEDVVNALRRGAATPDVVLVRLGQVDRDAMWWAVEEAVRQGLVSSTAEIQCGPDGLCGTTAPTVLSLADTTARKSASTAMPPQRARDD